LDYYHAALDSVNRLPGTAALAEPNTNGEWQMATGTTGSATGAVAGEGGIPPTEQLRSNALGLTAQALVLGCCLVLPILIVLWQDDKPLNAFAWIGVAYVFYVLIPYTLVCVANIIYHLRIERDKFNPIMNLVLPLLGIVINCYIFYKNFLLTYLIDSTDFTTQSSIAYIGIAVLLLLVGVSAWGITRAGGVRSLHRFSEVDAEAST
jgi:hypothetical protein